MRVFYSHSFAPHNRAKVLVFRGLLEEAVGMIDSQFRDGSGHSQLDFEIQEGNAVASEGPAGSIFPLIESSEVLVGLLLDEGFPSPCGFASAACLQEIVIAKRAGKRVLVWVERGCESRIGFLSSLTTYRSMEADSLMLRDQKEMIVTALREQLLGLVQPRSTGAGSRLYVNDFTENSRDQIRSLVWWRAHRDPQTGGVVREEPMRSGGQCLLRFGAESGGGCLLIANTRDTWNWDLDFGRSLTTLALLPSAPFSRGRAMSFQIHCRSSGSARIRPLFNGPAVDPTNPQDKERHDWDLIDPLQSREWDWRTVDSADGWVTKTYKCRVAYREGNVIQRPVTLYLVADTADHALFIDSIMLISE